MTIKIFYSIILPSLKKLEIGQYLEYRLMRDNNIYSYHKYLDNRLIYPTVYKSIHKSNRTISNIYHILKNIEKLSDGKIKRYRIFCELELEIICDYLNKSNDILLFTISIDGVFSNNRGILYSSFKKMSKIYFKQNCDGYEYNKISNVYELYIVVYKGFVNLCDDINYITNPPKFGIYL